MPRTLQADVKQKGRKREVETKSVIRKDKSENSKSYGLIYYSGRIAYCLLIDNRVFYTKKR